MTGKPGTSEFGHNGEQRGRLTIGYLTPWIHDPVFAVQWTGIDDVTRKRGVNLICFPGASLQFPDRFVRQRNTIYDLVTKESLDGLIMASAALATYISPEAFEAFYDRYRPLPMVSIGQELKDMPSVVADNEYGMCGLVTHLVETHGFSRIAFIRGPKGHPEAEQRYRIYADVLTGHGIRLDPDCIVPGDFARESGVEAIHILIEQRGLAPSTGFEAIVAANDEMALGALAALQARGIRVPGDVALVGFDDREEAKCVLPPLTTVRNPLYQLGARAAEMLLAQIEGRDVPECVVLPSDLVVRRSCGCMLPVMARAAARPATHLSTEDHRVPLADRRESALPALAQAVAISIGEAGSEWPEQLWDAFAGEIDGGESEEAFLIVLENALYQSAASNLDISAWQDALSALHDHALPHLSPDDATRAEELLGRAQVFVSDMAQRLHGYQAIQSARQTQILSEIDYTLSTTFEMAELLDVAVRQIPRADIPSFYIMLFEDPEAPADWSRLLLAYDGEKRTESQAEGQRFPSRQLLPPGLLSPEQRYGLVLELLYVRDHRLGFILFETKPSQEAICRVLWRQISGALWGVLLLQARQEAEAALEKAYVDLQAAQQDLIRQERLATLGRVAATVSHEIRNPLATIRFSASTIERKMRGKGLDIEPALDRMQRNITRCDTIISELLNYARVPELHPEPVRFDDWLNRVLDELTPPEGITLSRDLDSGVEISLDPERFRRLIVNLVDNACQAMLQLPETSKRARVLGVQSRVAAGRLEIVISDTGVGIPPDVMPHIFVPLFSTKSFGIGLGLSVVEEIVRQHGGEIEITSKVGEGTQAVVRLPLDREEIENT